MYAAVCLSCRSRDGQVLVTLLDGTLLSLNQGTGLIAWTLDLGRPLLSGSGVWQEQPAACTDPLLRTILPGADGSLYIFTDATGVQQSLEVSHDTVSQHALLCKHHTCNIIPMHRLAHIAIVAVQINVEMLTTTIFAVSKRYHNVCSAQTISRRVQCPDTATLSCLTLQRLPLSVPQLVSASPSATEDGGLVLGSHHSSVYVVDARTGTLLSVFPPDAATLASGSYSGTVHATCAAGVHILLHDTI